MTPLGCEATLQLASTDLAWMLEMLTGVTPAGISSRVRTVVLPLTVDPALLVAVIV